jgi:hypothetical protein
MKKGAVILSSLFLAFALCLPAVAQPNERAVETIVIDNFDNAEDMDWTWNVQATRFVTEGYPLISYFDGMPLSLRPYVKANDPAPKVLGVKTKFDRKGENWFEVFPVDSEGKRTEIEFVGNVTAFDFWVWGAGYLYYIDILVRDADGRTHVIPGGNLKFNGWRNLVINIPKYLNQHSRLRTGPKNLSFLGIRVRSDINEFVDDFVIYFDQIKYVTNTLVNVYDGYELRDADFGESESSSVSSSGRTASPEK